MNENISFEVKSDALAVIQQINIEANFAEMKAYLTDMLEPYKSMRVTNDMGAAKSARAYVNKVKKSIDDSRKLVKKLYQEPLAAFETRCKELTSICDEASTAIDAQIKEIENAEKEARAGELMQYFYAALGDVEGYIEWERIFDQKWVTKTYGMDNAKSDIDHIIETTRNNIMSIRALNSPFETTLLLVLKETGDIGKVLQKKAACEAIAERQAQMERDREREQEQRREIERIVSNTPETAQNAAESHEAPDHTDTQHSSASTESGEKTYTFTLEFEATKEQAFMIADFFKENGIKYRKVR